MTIGSSALGLRLSYISNPASWKNSAIPSSVIRVGVVGTLGNPREKMPDNSPFAAGGVGVLLIGSPFFGSLIAFEANSLFAAGGVGAFLVGSPFFGSLIVFEASVGVGGCGGTGPEGSNGARLPR